MNISNDVTPIEASPITTFVITLGKQLLQEKVRDWLDMDAVARFCRDHNIQLDGQCPGSEEVETQLRRFFQPNDQFYSEGINVDGYERPQGWERPFMIRAFPYSSKQHSILAHLGELDAVGLETACSD